MAISPSQKSVEPNNSSAGLPRQVVRFLWVGGAIFLLWKMAYLLWLQPSQILDKPLVDALASQSTALLNRLHNPPLYSFETFNYQQKLAGEAQTEYEGYMARISYNTNSLLLIVRNCNALELMVLYLGFLLAYPATWKRKIAYALPGLLAIHMVNVLRCAGLVALANSPYQRFFHFTHHYLFSITIYAFIFLLWYLFAKGAKPAQIA